MDIFKKILQLFPDWVVYFVGFVYGLTRFKKSYAQYGEDLILDNYFKYKKINKGIYVDIGCYHPVWISNTYIFHKKGWLGYAIDIDKRKIAYYKLMRGTKCMVKWAALVAEGIDHGKTQIVYKFKRPYSSIDTVDKETADRYSKNINEKYVVEHVPKISVCDYFSTMNKVNLLNIDIEGIDEDVLMNVDLHVLDPDAIVFENNNDKGGSDTVKRYLVGMGYKLLFISGGSVCYAKY